MTKDEEIVCRNFRSTEELNLAIHSEIPQKCKRQTKKCQKVAKYWQKLPKTVCQSFSCAEFVKKLRIYLKGISEEKSFILCNEVV